MTGRSHALLGMGAGILGAAHSPADTLLRVAIVGVAIVCALLPDVDHPRAIISGYLPGVGHAARLFVSHRGGTHTVIFAAAITALLFIVHAPSVIIFAAAAGIISHLLADMATPQGVPLLLPLSRRAFRLAPRAFLTPTAWILESFSGIASLTLILFVLWGKL